jgi:probable HAF family extracellular repeat protein
MSIRSSVRTHPVVIRAGQFVLIPLAVLFAALTVMARVPTPVDLGTLGGSNSYGQALNDRGQVVGLSNLAGNASYHAFSWTSAAGMIDLGTLGGESSNAYAVNRHGQVVGVSNLAGDASYHAFAWTSAGRMIDLGTLGGSFSYASGVNKRGQIIDTSDIAGNAASHAVLWEPGDKRQ